MDKISMYNNNLKYIITFLLVILISAQSSAQDVSGFIGIEGKYFHDKPLDDRQYDHYGFSVALQPELYYDWDRGDQSLLFTPFFRYDQRDDRRTHWDIRELFYAYYTYDWELKVGIQQKFWGVTESQHLVDILNQSDFVENIDGEQKLGQPMIDFALVQDWGTFNAFILVGFRERTFPGIDGRLRFPAFVNTDIAVYESSQEYKHIDFAARYTNTIDELDFGLSYFWGTSRDPNLLPSFLLPEANSNDSTELIPFYSLIHQIGLDAQLTTESGWIFKLEAIWRQNKLDDYFASTVGFEYTFSNISESGLDIGVIGEYLYDTRKPLGLTGDFNRFKFPPTPFYNHVFVGSRFAFNDVQSTDLLIGGIISLENGSTFFNVEGSRRVGNSFKLSIEYRGFVNLEPIDLFYGFKNDSYAGATLDWFF
jgi:hypothetical protein